MTDERLARAAAAFFTDEDKALITRLAGEGVYKGNIAKRIGAPMRLVSAWMDSEGIKIMRVDRASRRETELCAVAESDTNCFRAAVAVLGRRYEERGGNMFLDGVPSNLDAIMVAANRIRRAWFLPQLGRNKAWHVPE